MEVKERVKTITVTEKMYVACDGEEFQSERDCLAYEDRLQESEDAECVEKLKSFELCAPSGEDFYHWAYLTNEDELLSFIRYWVNVEDRSFHNYEDTSSHADLREFPLWVVAIVDDDGYGGVFNANDVIAQHENFVEGVRNAMKEMEETK